MYEIFCDSLQEGMWFKNLHIVTQRVIRPSYFYTFSTLCGKFMLLLAQALHAVCPGIVVISGI